MENYERFRCEMDMEHIFLIADYMEKRWGVSAEDIWVRYAASRYRMHLKTDKISLTPRVLYELHGLGYTPKKILILRKSEKPGRWLKLNDWRQDSRNIYRMVI